MALANCFPDDDSIEFVEEVPIYDGRSASDFAALRTCGGILGRPAFASGEDVLSPEFQYFSRTWNHDDPAPDFGEDLTRAAWSWPGPVLASQTVLFYSPPDELDEISLLDAQLRWRIAWKIIPIGDVTRPNPWNFIHLRFKEATYLHSGTLDPEAPDAVGGLVAKGWQYEIDGEPDGYDHDDPETWPGTDWYETAVPSAPAESGGYAQTIWHPRWPQLWTFNPASQPTPVIVGAGALDQGLIPGGRRMTSPFLHPRSNGKTLS